MTDKLLRDEQQFPFELRVPNAETRAAMEEARAGNVERFDSVEALMDDLLRLIE